MNTTKFRIFYLLLFLTFLFSCNKERLTHPINFNETIASFYTETGIKAVYVFDTALLNTVKGWQGHGAYPGVDNWTTAKIPHDFDLYGGLPGQSEYYTIYLTIIVSDTMKAPYWESLQVKANPEFGYRPMVGVFDIKDSIVVAISKTLANLQYGAGGGWQIYVEDFTTDLVVFDTIYLK